MLVVLIRHCLDHSRYAFWPTSQDVIPLFSSVALSVLLCAMRTMTNSTSAPALLCFSCCCFLNPAGPLWSVVLRRDPVLQACSDRHPILPKRPRSRATIPMKSTESTEVHQIHILCPSYPGSPRTPPQFCSLHNLQISRLQLGRLGEDKGVGIEFLVLLVLFHADPLVGAAMQAEDEQQTKRR